MSSPTDNDPASSVRGAASSTGDGGVGDFAIQISNRKILRGLLRHLGVTDPEVTGAVLREIDKKDLQCVHGLAKLPTGQPRVRGCLLQIPGDLVCGKVLQRVGADRLKKLLDPAYVPAMEFLRNALFGEELQVPVPVGRGTVCLCRVSCG